MIDDSALLHGGVYNAQKAHEYYMRNRHLKGRTSGSELAVVRKSGSSKASSNRTPAPMEKKSHTAQLAAERAALQGRLDHLRDILAKLVAEAKKKAGVDTKSPSTDSSSTKDKKSSTTKDSKTSKLTEKEKREKAKKAREDYKPEPSTGGGSSSPEIEAVKRQIAEIRSKLQATLKQSQDSHANTQTATN